MAVALVPRFTKADITRMLIAKRKSINNAILLNLKRVGESFISSARNTNTYKDQTGNLRSSIGYVILYNGLQLTKGGFVKIDKTGTGVAAGEKLIEKLAKKHGSGWALIAVAGMEYAAAVEAKGFDVISASSIEAENQLKTALKRIANKVK